MPEPGFFNPDKDIPNSSPVYVGWFDIIGGDNLTKISLTKATIFVMKLFSMANHAKNDVDIYPSVNGFFAVHENQEEFLNFAKKFFLSTYEKLFEKARNDHRFLIRGSIAYGNVVIGKHITRIYPFKDNIIIGDAVSQAFKSIQKAPPYGIYIDETARLFPTRVNSIQYVYYRWFSNGLTFGKSITGHLDWCKEHSYSNLYDTNEIEKSILLAQDYFNITKIGEKIQDL